MAPPRQHGHKRRADSFVDSLLVISFAVLDNPEPLYLLELLGQTAFFGTC